MNNPEFHIPSTQDEDTPTGWDILTEEAKKAVVDEKYLESENAHNGSHFMTPEENAEYERLWKTNMIAAVKYLRDKWAEHVDRDFIQGFKCVHWMPNSESLEHIDEMLGDGKHEKEISTQAYEDSGSLQTNRRWLDSKVGLLIDGTVNLASNQDIQTNQWHGVIIEEDDNIKRRKYTEYANRLMTSRDNCVSPYEFIIGGWSAKAIVADPDAITPELRAISEKYNIPIITTDDKSIFEQKEEA